MTLEVSFTTNGGSSKRRNLPMTPYHPIPKHDGFETEPVLGGAWGMVFGISTRATWSTLRQWVCRASGQAQVQVQAHATARMSRIHAAASRIVRNQVVDAKKREAASR